MWNIKKNDTNKPIYKTKIDSQTQKMTLWLPKKKGAQGINQEFEINRYTLLYKNRQTARTYCIAEETIFRIM